MTTLEASVDQISIVLGQPYCKNDEDFPDAPDKVNVCWCVQAEDGSIVTIWDYKQPLQPNAKIRPFSVWYNSLSAWSNLQQQISTAFSSHQDLVQANTSPMPGDAVIFTGKQFNILLSSNAIGIIEGKIGQKKAKYTVIFNCQGMVFRGKPYAYSNSNESVMCSGGPGYYIAPEALTSSGKTLEFTFWRWKDIPCADGGERYKLEVPLWLWFKN